MGFQIFHTLASGSGTPIYQTLYIMYARIKENLDVVTSRVLNLGISTVIPGTEQFLGQELPHSAQNSSV